MASPVRREERTRVTFFLPVNNAREEQALMAVVRHLVGERRAAAPMTGFTYSNLANGVFSGTWWRAGSGRRKGAWVGPENIILFIVDFGQKIDDRKLEAALGRLKRAIIRAYRRGSPQEEVWLVAERIVRYA